MKWISLPPRLDSVFVSIRLCPVKLHDKSSVSQTDTERIYIYISECSTGKSGHIQSLQECRDLSLSRSARQHFVFFFYCFHGNQNGNVLCPMKNHGKQHLKIATTSTVRTRRKFCSPPRHLLSGVFQLLLWQYDT